MCVCVCVCVGGHDARNFDVQHEQAHLGQPPILTGVHWHVVQRRAQRSVCECTSTEVRPRANGDPPSVRPTVVAFTQGPPPDRDQQWSPPARRHRFQRKVQALDKPPSSAPAPARKRVERLPAQPAVGAKAGGRYSSLVCDERPLPLPEPFDKHEPQKSRNRRHQDPWTWASWREWMKEAGSRRWYKPGICRGLRLRDQDPANKGANLSDAAAIWNKTGWIYGLFHFATGRWYVGQTIRRYWFRAMEHWHQRKTLKDMLHFALANELTPFSFVVFPLEYISEQYYMDDDWETAKENFRLFATPRERYWVGRLNSLWPQGFNSAYPGKPVSAWVRRQWQLPEPDRMRLTPDAEDHVARRVQQWLDRLHNNGGMALLEMKDWDKNTLRESLDWIQQNVPARERRANLIAVETAIIDMLREKRANRPKRHFLKVTFLNNQAAHLLLPHVLRDPQVYSKHPEPEVAAAIMVVNKFQPQVQALLCNFAKAAQEFQIDTALHDTLEDCKCQSALLRPDQEHLNQEGHVCTVDTRKLRWPYLRSLVQRGRKYRLDSDMDDVFLNLRKALEEYCLWCSRGKSERLNALEKWADAVYEHCRRNWAEKLQSPGFVPENPSGYPHLRRAIQEAHQTLVFLLDDRAPHGFFVVCKRWYQREMAKYLSDNDVFEACDLTWEGVVEQAKGFNERYDFATGTGIVYNYGIWKPTKGRFRFIAGTRSGPKPRIAPSRPAGPPRQPLYEAHKALVRILQHVEDALKDKDKIRQSDEGIKAFWGIDSVNAFTRMVRANADVVLKNGQVTVDFCTMYTSFPFRSMCDRTLSAIDEAWDFVTQREAGMAEDGASPALTLGPKGWSKVGKGFSKAQVAEFLTYLIEHNYVFIGGRILRQIKGMPMGMPAAPQIANLACYPVEKAQAYALGPGRAFVVCRYIDDIYSAGVPLPSQEDYGMEYKITAKGRSVVYLGVRVYEKEREDGGKVLHTTVHDREESYPHHIVRYPDHTTVAPRQQLGGVIMGRLVHCQETCSPGGL